MNERIFHMARQSGATDEEGKYADRVFCFTKDELNGFAESIVRECITKIKMTEVPRGNIPALSMVVRTLKEHFGVEE